MQMTDDILRNFCKGDERRAVTYRPWSVGDYSYATDGTIIVRVPRLDDVPPPHDRTIEKTAAKIDEWMARLADANRVPVPRIELPTPKSWCCDTCDGRGTKHDCRSCDCECYDCDGTGRCQQPIVVAWRGAYIAGQLWKLIAELPGSTIVASPPSPPIYDHAGFAFDGGVGVVMAMRKPKDSDPLMVDAEPAATVAAWYLQALLDMRREAEAMN